MLKNWLRDIRNSTPKITKRIVFNFGWYFCIILGKIRKFHIFWGFRWEVSPAWASLYASLYAMPHMLYNVWYAVTSIGITNIKNLEESFKTGNEPTRLFDLKLKILKLWHIEVIFEVSNFRNIKKVLKSKWYVTPYFMLRRFQKSNWCAKLLQYFLILPNIKIKVITV